MKSIINGRRYDTGTAEELASWHNGCSSSDFNHCKETLYRTKSGSLFLHGKGGALSAYAESYEGGRSFGDGSRIQPMTEDEAVEWLELREKVEEIETHFPSHVQDA